MPAERPFIAYAVQRFPALRTTFIRREVEALRARGLPIEVCSMRPADIAEVRSEREAAEHLRTTHYLPAQPAGVVSLAANVSVSLRHPWAALRSWGLLAADPGAPGIGRRARVALQIWRGAVMARQLQCLGRCEHVHAQFADGAATTAMVCARLLGVPFSFTSHTSFDPPALKQKLLEASFVASISEYDRQRLIKVAGADIAERIHIVRCGVPLEQWPIRTTIPKNSPQRIVSVGALVETKGHDDLIRACGVLRDRGRNVLCEIIGAGPLEGELRRLIVELGLVDQVCLAGPLPQQAVRERLYSADLFVLACKPARNGDTEGVPVSLMEAMAAGVPVVSCRVSGVPELLDDGRCGGLVTPADPRQLAAAVDSRLFGDGDHAATLAAARNRIEIFYSQTEEAKRLAKLFSACVTTNGSAPGNPERSDEAPEQGIRHLREDAPA